MNQSDLAARLLALFIDELDDQIPVANEHLLALERSPGESEELRSLFRVMHTLKGAAHSAGVPSIEELCHRLEALLAAARDGNRALAPSELDTLFSGVDSLAAGARSLRATGSVVPPSDAPQARRRESRVDVVVPAAEVASAPAPASVASPEIAELTAPREAALRVGKGRVDALFASANRLLVVAVQTGDLLPGLEQLHDDAMNASKAWRRRRRMLEPSVTPANFSSAHSEAARDLLALDEAMKRLQRDSSRLLTMATQHSREANGIARDVSLGVRELRMRPFADAIADLPRVVRDVAVATGKLVRLETSGDEVSADRVVLTQMHEALLHLVRNAIDHGIEAPDVRRSRGKAEEGVIRIRAGLTGDRIVVTVSDDGAGLDIAAVRKWLASRGENASADDRTVARRLFSGGISTRGEATAISGRGVGLDAVRESVDRMRGSVDVTWTRNAGTTFTIEAPLTLATIRAVLVRVGRSRIAIPTAFVERMMRLQPADLQMIDGRQAVHTGEAPALVASLAKILGPPLVEADTAGAQLFVMVRAGTDATRIALRVDELIDEVEIVVRPIRSHGRAPLPHISGSAMLASGAIALVLNVHSVIATAIGMPAEAKAVAPDAAASARHRRVLVVDDSITTRTLEGSMLEAAGYEVITAVDGADGWRVLQEQGAELVVTDVEMPRMDGIQLCEAIRASARFRAIPVILVTSLESPVDRARGLEAGADAYLGKSSFRQEELLRTIRELMD